MDILIKKINEFLKIINSSGSGSGYGYGYGDGSGDGSGSGSGYGYGDGSGSGYGYGDGSGSGSGYGYGDGSGSGSGYGYGDGSGDGSGSGSGYGSGYGYGYGYGDGSGSGYGYGYIDGSGSGYGSGYGSGLKSINNMNIYIIDGIESIITNIHGNIAKGYIVNKDLTLNECFIVKNENLFAHGKTLKEANENIKEKIFINLDIDEKLEEFKKLFNKSDKYQGKKFYEWHHYLTGSCKMGRDNFVKNNNINLNKYYTVKEFITITENAFGNHIIIKLKNFYR